MVDDSSPSSGGSDMTLIIAAVAVLAVAAVGAVLVLKRKKA
jgi:LPXTG-motif cell wall-anchored protein